MQHVCIYGYLYSVVNPYTARYLKVVIFFPKHCELADEGNKFLNVNHKHDKNFQEGAFKKIHNNYETKDVIRDDLIM